MNRSILGTLTLAILTAGACGGGSQLPVPAPRDESEVVREGVLRLLELSNVEGVLGSRAPGFSRQTAILMGDPSDAELERLIPAVVEAFSYESLHNDVVDYMVEEGSPELVRETLEWMEGGATAAVRRIGEEYQPAQTLEEYANELTDEPPSEARIQLIAAWVEAKGEGAFFVLMQEALREAAYRVNAAMRRGAPPFAPLSGDELEVAQINSHGASVIRFLHGYAPAPDQLIRRATAEWESESGLWFVETYTLAVAGAIRAAGERAARGVSGSEGA